MPAHPHFAVREALVSDMPELTRIYNHAIAHTGAVWRDDPATVAEREQWLAAHHASGTPVLVIARGDVVAGYAPYGNFRPFPGYRYTAEHSIYLHPAWQHQGLGGILLDALVDSAREHGIHVLVAVIDSENDASIALHRRRGFEECGSMREVGWKFGQWRDLVFMSRILSAEGPTPAYGS